jgi:hypothetical protein
MTEKQTEKPELLNLIDFIHEVNERTDKEISGLFEVANRFLELPPTVSNDPQASKHSAAIGALHNEITKANMNIDRLMIIRNHLNKLI